MKLNEWIEASYLGDHITHIMYGIFEENCEGIECTASIKVKSKDGFISDWKHPPSDTLVGCKPEFTFNIK